MKLHRSFRALLACAAMLQIAATDGANRLVAPALPGFLVGFEASGGGETIREEVPTGETVQTWTRLVTTQRFEGLASSVTLPTYLANIGASVKVDCAGAMVADMPVSARNGHPAAQIRVDCPRVPSTGKPETFIMLAIADGRDVYVKQVAFRRVPTAEDIRWGETFLAAVTLCAPDPNGPGCATSPLS